MRSSPAMNRLLLVLSFFLAPALGHPEDLPNPITLIEKVLEIKYARNIAREALTATDSLLDQIKQIDRFPSQVAIPNKDYDTLSAFNSKVVQSLTETPEGHFLSIRNSGDLKRYQRLFLLEYARSAFITNELDLVLANIAAIISGTSSMERIRADTVEIKKKTKVLETELKDSGPRFHDLGWPIGLTMVVGSYFLPRWVKPAIRALFVFSGVVICVVSDTYKGSEKQPNVEEVVNALNSLTQDYVAKKYTLKILEGKTLDIFRE